jgi:hypothetical protein
MESNKKIIAIAGNARSGKDTLGKHLVSILGEYGIKAKCYSFASQLRKETDEFLLKTLNISAYTEDNDEKNIIRPFLVFWGTEIRRKLDDLIWIKQVESMISDNEVAIITDLRFQNEMEFVKNNNGQIICLSRIDEDGLVVPPANEYELENNAVIAKQADSNFTWFTSDNEELLKSLTNELLDTILTKERFESWKATCL